jgi:hypothetical protein
MLKFRSKLASLVVISCSITASYANEYVLQFNLNKNVSSPAPVYDENGFDENGIHKETGTIYNPDGYGVLVCNYNRPKTYWSDFAGYASNGLVVVYEGSHQGYRAGHKTSFLSGEYRYIRGEFQVSDVGQLFFTVCRQVVKP